MMWRSWYKVLKMTTNYFSLCFLMKSAMLTSHSIKIDKNYLSFYTPVHYNCKFCTSTGVDILAL